MCYWTSYTPFGIAMVEMVDVTIAVILCDVQSNDSGYMTMTMLTLVDISYYCKMVCTVRHCMYRKTYR